MYVVFYKTSDVFAAEERLQADGLSAQVVPTPVQDKAYCGVCLQVEEPELERAQALLEGMDYRLAGG